MRLSRPLLLITAKHQGITAFQALFWLHQLLIGLPSVFLAGNLIATGKAEGALYTISWFLAWIGGTLTWGFASLLQSKSEFRVPIPIFVKTEAGEPETGFDGEYMGYRYRVMMDKTVEIETSEGPVSYSNWKEFVRALKRNG